MNDTMHDHLENTRSLLSFENKAVVSLDTGKKLGSVQDILIDPGNMSIEGIVTSAGSFLRSNVSAIKAEEVKLWGEDVVLVNRSDVIRNKEELTGLDNCLSAYDNIPGRDVISLEGDRLGKVEDLQITPDGQLAGFTISRVRNGLADMLSQDRKDRYDLPISALHSFGKDVLILDIERVKDMLPTTAREEIRTEVLEEEQDFIPATGSDVDDTPGDDIHTR
jgi:sporulation protein YlmC with PRC-barrel domain